MTQSLSAEELAALKKRIEDYPPSMTQSHWTQRELPALLAMASRLVELESAFEHVRQHGDVLQPGPGIYYLKSPERFREYAKLLGWPGPTSQAKGG